VNGYVEVLIDAVLNGFSIHVEENTESARVQQVSANQRRGGLR